MVHMCIWSRVVRLSIRTYRISRAFARPARHPRGRTTFSSPLRTTISAFDHLSISVSYHLHLNFSHFITILIFIFIVFIVFTRHSISLHTALAFELWSFPLSASLRPCALHYSSLRLRCSLSLLFFYVPVFSSTFRIFTSHLLPNIVYRRQFPPTITIVRCSSPPPYVLRICICIHRDHGRHHRSVGLE